MFHVKQISTGSPFEAEMGYSRAIVKGGWCFVSGVTGYDYHRMLMPEGAAAQTEACFQTINRVLAEAGFETEDIVRVQYTLLDAAFVPLISPVLSAHLGKVRPAATMIIAGLIKPEMLIEIEVTAFKG
jgi:enamine deaminase RidA (YjgF/YER057c/UK114 family)